MVAYSLSLFFCLLVCFTVLKSPCFSLCPFTIDWLFSPFCCPLGIHPQTEWSPVFLVAHFPGSAKETMLRRDKKGAQVGSSSHPWVPAPGFQQFLHHAPSPMGAASPLVLWPHYRQKLFSWFLLSLLRNADIHKKAKQKRHYYTVR